MAAATHFVVIFERATVAQKNALVVALRSEPNVGWWHWLSSGWLITDTAGRDAAFWRQFFTSYAKQANVLVIPTQPNGYAGRMKRGWSNWFEKNWKTSSPDDLGFRP